MKIYTTLALLVIHKKVKEKIIHNKMKIIQLE